VEIAEKLRDALSMFWQSLDTDERRILIGGIAWVMLSLVATVAQERRREWEREQIAESVARRLSLGS
jgi:hypothetical protein